MVFDLSLATFADRFGLSASQVDKLTVYADALTNDPLAPTTVREPHAVRDDHLADALVALDLPLVRTATVIADLGSGAGVPGLPLAVALPAPGSRCWMAAHANVTSCAKLPT